MFGDEERGHFRMFMRMQENFKVRGGDKEGWGDGRGLIRFRKKSGEVTFECWPRFADVTQPGAKQFPGCPVTVRP